MLRAVDLVCGEGIPVLGVNVGHLGYLTAVDPSGLRTALERFLAGDYLVEGRMTLDISFGGPGGDAPPGRSRSALNDVVIQRTQVGHTMHTEVAVNSVPFLTFASDSLILATPTGSTAYNLSARGPIVSPKARVQVLTPVAPHMLFDRSLVLDADDEVRVTVTGDQPVDVVIDGWHSANLTPGQFVGCRGGSRDALLVTFGERNFHRILKSKFNLTDR
jgi:NAD+ kinase